MLGGVCIRGNASINIFVLLLNRTIGRKQQELVYSDTTTYSGPDEQPLFDTDDELVVMAKDLGDIRPEKLVAKPKYVQQVSEK